MKNEIPEARLMKRLDAIILLLLESSDPSAKISMTAKVLKLMEFGFPQPEVAAIIGRPLNYVTAIASGQKRTKKRE